MIKLTFADWILRAAEVMAVQGDRDTIDLLVTDLPAGWTSWVCEYRHNYDLNTVELELAEDGWRYTFGAGELGFEGDYWLQLCARNGSAERRTNKVKVHIDDKLAVDAVWPQIPSAITDAVGDAIAAKEQAQRADSSAINAMQEAKGYRDEAASMLGQSVRRGGDIRNTATYATAGELPVNQIFRIYGAALPDLPEITNGEIVTLCHSDTLTNGATQIFTTSAGTQYARIMWSSEWKDWKATTQTAGSEVVIPLSLFPRVGVIGDSYASGTSHDTEDGAATMHPAMSWPEIIARHNGIEVARYAKGGLSTITWQTDAAGLPAMQADEDCDLYILALGRNDYGNMLGDNPTETIAEFKANYNAIIAAVRAKAPNACLVLMTTDYSDEVGTELNDAIGELASENGIPCMVQLEDDYFRNTAAKIYKWKDSAHGYSLAGGHPQPYQYAGMALAIERMLSRCITENQAYFFYFVSDREITHGGGANVTMADNADGGVDLTVNGTVRTLAKQEDISPEKQMEKVADYTAEIEESSVRCNLSKPCRNLLIRATYRCPEGQKATITLTAYTGFTLSNYLMRVGNANTDKLITVSMYDMHGIRDIHSTVAEATQTGESNVGGTMTSGDRYKDGVKLNQSPVDAIVISAASGYLVGAGTKIEVWGC